MLARVAAGLLLCSLSLSLTIPFTHTCAAQQTGCLTNTLAPKQRKQGPTETPYEGGAFELAINVPEQYPLVPPAVRFRTRVFHPNVHFKTGEICLDILKTAWSPAWTLHSVCQAVLALMSDPAADSPLNCDAGGRVVGGCGRVVVWVWLWCLCSCVCACVCVCVQRACGAWNHASVHAPLPPTCGRQPAAQRRPARLQLARQALHD